MECSGDFAGELFVQFGVFAAQVEEGAVGAAFDDFAVFEDEDEVGAGDGAEAVGDDEGGAVGDEFFKGVLDEHFGVGVDGGGGFVEHEDAGVGEESAGEADELALAEGHLGAAFADLGVVTVLEAFEDFVAAEFLGGGDDLGLGGGGGGVADVVQDGAAEEVVVLRDDAHLFVEGFGGDLVEVVAVEEDAAALGEIEAADEVHDGAFAAAGVTDQGDGLPGLGIESDVVEDGLVLDVLEVDVIEGDAAVDAGEGDGVGGVGDGGFLFEECEDAFGGGHGLHHVVLEGTESEDGAHEPVPVEDQRRRGFRWRRRCGLAAGRGGRGSRRR